MGGEEEFAVWGDGFHGGGDEGSVVFVDADLIAFFIFALSISKALSPLIFV